MIEAYYLHGQILDELERAKEAIVKYENAYILTVTRADSIEAERAKDLHGDELDSAAAENQLHQYRTLVPLVEDLLAEGKYDEAIGFAEKLATVSADLASPRI